MQANGLQAQSPYVDPHGCLALAPEYVVIFLTLSFELYDRNADIKGESGDVSDVNEEYVLGTGGKMILVTKQQRTWLNCVPVFGGR